MVVSVSDFNSFLKKILSEELSSIQEIIIPSKSNFKNNDNLFFRQLTPEDKTIDLGSYRTIDPVKFLFYMPREKVLPAKYKVKKRLITGLKACDINALSILDSALTKSGFIDQSYEHWRNNSIIISSDCSELLPNCFCTFIGGKPFAEKGFDLNLSEVYGEYLITIGSIKGEEFLDMMKKHITVYNRTKSIIQEVNSRREKLVEKLNCQIQTKLKVSEDKYSEKDENNIWIEASRNCVGCGSCTNICPSCYCLILNDESKDKEFVKVRTYDSCQLHGYSKVAGGGTPRPKAYQRFRNRVMCKFSYMKSNFNSLGCTGCGRCMDVCSTGYDFVFLAKRVSKMSGKTARETVS